MPHNHRQPCTLPRGTVPEQRLQESHTHTHIHPRRTLHFHPRNGLFQLNPSRPVPHVREERKIPKWGWIAAALSLGTDLSNQPASRHSEKLLLMTNRGRCRRAASGTKSKPWEQKEVELGESIWYPNHRLGSRSQPRLDQSLLLQLPWGLPLLGALFQLPTENRWAEVKRARLAHQLSHIVHSCPSSLILVEGSDGEWRAEVLLPLIP